jgi:hypothetical protein
MIVEPGFFRTDLLTPASTSKGRDLIAQANAYQDFSSSLAHDD